MLGFIIVAIIVILALVGWGLHAAKNSEAAAYIAANELPPPATLGLTATAAAPAPQAPLPPKYVGPLTKPQIEAAGIADNEIVRCPNDGAIAQIIRGARMSFPTMKSWEAQGRPAYRNISCDLFYAIPDSGRAYGENPVVHF